MGAQIKAIAYYYPEKKLSNQDLQQEFPDYDFSKFEKKVGIVNRYVVEGKTTALDLAEQACLKMFQQTDAATIDFVLYCTQSPEYYLPTTACLLQKRLKLSTRVGAFDFNLGCSGYTYGLGMAKGLIESGQAKNVLLVTAETYSRYLHPKDKSNRAIFGDAASATLISYSETEGLGQFCFGSDGNGAEHLIIRNGCSIPYNSQAPEIIYGTDNIYTDNHLYMNGPEIYSFTTQVIPGFIAEVLQANQLQQDDLDQFILHQANAYMLNQIRKRVGVDEAHFFVDLADGGNTVSCTIPIALKKYMDCNSTGKPQKVMLVGFGVGLSWSGGVVTI